MDDATLVAVAVTATLGLLAAVINLALAILHRQQQDPPAPTPPAVVVNPIQVVQAPQITPPVTKAEGPHRP